MIALILGGAPEVFAEATEAAALLNRRHIVVAANLAGIHWPGKLDGWCSLHPDLMAGWAAQRRGNADFRGFSTVNRRNPGVEIAPERWPGSSGLYACQVALFELGATAAILCGVPLDSDAGHFDRAGPWEGVGDYRQAFATALPEIGGRVRSLGGWTASLFGKPTAEWVGAVDNIKPAGPARPDERTIIMFKVTNGGEGTFSFWARTPDGGDRRVHLQPGEGDVFDLVNAEDPVFAVKGVTVKASSKPAPKQPAAVSLPNKPPPAPRQPTKATKRR